MLLKAAVPLVFPIGFLALLWDGRAEATEGVRGENISTSTLYFNLKLNNLTLFKKCNNFNLYCMFYMILLHACTIYKYTSFKSIVLFYAYWYFAYVYVCVPHV